MANPMNETRTFDLSEDGGGARAWYEMLQYHADNRPEPVTTPDIIEDDHQRITDLINDSDRSLQLTEIATDLDLDPTKLKPVLRSLASEGNFKALEHRYVSNDIWNQWEEDEQFRCQHER